MTDIQSNSALSDAYLSAYFASFRQLLAPDGIAIITTPNDEDLHASETYCPHCDQVFHRWQHLRSWTAESLAAAVSTNGFAVSQIHFKYPFPSSFASPNSNSFRFAWRHGAAYLADSGAAT